MSELIEVLGKDDSCGNLTEKQQTAIELLAAGTSVSETARQLGVTRATVSRWANQDVAFFTALNQVRRDMHESHRDQLRSLAGRALGVLEELLDKETPPHLRFRAAVAVIEATKAIEGEVGETSQATLEMGNSLKKLQLAMYLHMIADAHDEREERRERNKKLLADAERDREERKALKQRR